MRYLLLSGMLMLVSLCLDAQTPYFPPAVAGSDWETTDPASLGWCPERIDSLYNYLGAHNTKAFIVLKDGRIVLEHYFGTFTQDSLWYWASAGKTLTGTMVGIAQEEGSLDITQPTATYLGAGWTGESPGLEQQITVRHQLTMTTGLNDGVANVDCTDPGCLTYLADAGTRWAYHNAPYTLLQDVVANATGQLYGAYFNTRLRDPIGMDGFWIPLDDLSVYFSTARSMARFGLLALNRMVWDGDTLLHDTAYFNAATTPSQSLNLSYGYLWWLNGQPTYMLPQTQFIFPGPLMPNAPEHMFNGLGKNDQLLNVVPGQGLVLVRMGNAADVSLQVSSYFNNLIWQYMNELDCTTGTGETGPGQGFSIMPNPASAMVRIAVPTDVGIGQVLVLDGQGRTVLSVEEAKELDVRGLRPGLYLMRVSTTAGTWTNRLVKE
ncbi:MAG: serine hydrolase [Flavobacteriales bacterium]|nr:serine hydrolase [Flavobacteriales bacterium]